MIQDDPEKGLKRLQLLSWSLFIILSFDKWYLAINTPLNCKSEMNIHIKFGDKGSSEIASFTYLHTPLPYAFLL